MGYIINGTSVIYLGEYRNSLKIQKYEEIKSSITKSGISFKDSEFPQNKFSLGESAYNSKIFWLRAKDIVKNPLFIEKQEGDASGCSRFDIIQGALTDCWFLVAIDVIVENKPLISMVVPEENSFDNDNSVFHFRFWKSGFWIDVVVDDMLPCYKDNFGVTKLAFASNRNREFWVPLLEKAYAKLNGNYSMLNLGCVGDALEDLTGGVSVDLMLHSPTSLPQDEIKELIIESHERGSLICLQISSLKSDAPGETKMENGLARGHAYSLTGLGEVPYRGEKVLLTRIRNPWGSDFEWNGPWSDGSEEWKSFDKKKVEILNLKRGDGEFWMSFDDMFDNFDLLGFCHLAYSTKKEKLLRNPSLWHGHEFHGIWPGAGCINAEEITKNPQYCLEIEDIKGEEVSLIIAVLNKAIRLTGKDQLEDSYFPAIYRVNNPASKIVKRFGPEAIINKKIKLERNPVAALDRESFDSFKVKKGSYVIIPIYGRHYGVVGSFLLRAFTDGKSSMTQLL